MCVAFKPMPNRASLASRKVSSIEKRLPYILMVCDAVRSARLVAKILRGTRPQDLPVEGADKIDLAVNLKTARLLGVTVPRKVLLRADLLRR